MDRFWRWGAAMLAGLWLLAGCGRQHLLDPAPTAPQPSPLVVEQVGNNFVTLRWAVRDSSRVTGYHVYRRSEIEPDFQLAYFSSIQRIKATGLQNGQAYAFKVAALNTSGREGPFSQVAFARPALFNIAINGLADVTNTPSVQVQVSSAGLNQVRLAETVADLTLGPYQNIPSNNVVSFTLTGVDGAKTLYAQFRDSNTGQESEVISDSIELDRFAKISSVTEDTGGQAKTAGQTIHFTLDSGEVDGTAIVDIGTARTGVRLFDDGTNGDPTARDGKYETNYLVEPTFDVNAAFVTGKFTDRAGNSAAPVTAAGTVTISNPPPPVTLTSAVALGGGRVQLQWTQSGATDFFSYRVRHSASSPVSPGGVLDTTITVRSGTTGTVGGLAAGAMRFVVEVVDNAGNFSPSNELAVAVTAAGAGPARLGALPGAASEAATLTTWSVTARRADGREARAVNRARR